MKKHNKVALTGLAAAALAFAPPAHADVPDAIVGSWAAADGQYSAVIDQGGHGHLAYADYNRCPTCFAAGAPRTTVDFTLVSASGNTASGTDGSGDAVTAKVQNQSLWLTVGTMPTFVFPAHNGVMH